MSIVKFNTLNVLFEFRRHVIHSTKAM